MKTSPDAHKLSFVGTRGGGGFERDLVQATDLPLTYESVLAGPVVGVSPLRALGSAAKIVLGTLQSFRILTRHQPNAILLTGGWANVPLALAAWLRRVPMLVYLPDIEPGRTIQFLGRIARRVAVTVPDSQTYFRPGQAVVTGYPLRQGFMGCDRASARRHLGLDAHKPVLAVTGGSRGARTINQALLAILPELLADGVQVIHVTGRLDWGQIQAEMPPLPEGSSYLAMPYTDEMGTIYAAADLVLTRSGASVLGELPHYGLPAVLVPYPYAWRYQKTNADYLAERGAAVRLDDERMPEELLPTLRSLLGDPDRLALMRARAKALGEGDGAGNLAAELLTLAGVS